MRRSVRRLALFALLVVGCAPRETQFTVQGFRDPRNPERFVQQFPPGWFATDAHGDWDILFELRRPPSTNGAPATSAPATRPETSANDGESAAGIGQIVHLRAFWRPQPGASYVDRSQTSALVTYVLLRGGDAVSYEGAGFACFKVSRDGRTITGALESSSLVPVRSTGQPPDLFGPCHVEGTFTAHLDKARVVELCHEIRRSLGPPAAPSAADAPRAGP